MEAFPAFASTSTRAGAARVDVVDRGTTGWNSLLASLLLTSGCAQAKEGDGSERW